jgi:hypothetical protein
MVQIDQIDTEIEIAPSSSSAAPAPSRSATTTHPTNTRAAGREMLAILEAELEQYTRMRG